MDKKPNIVIFNPDHYRGEALGHVGNPCVRTPNLDRLCETDAVSFSNTFCQNPVCTPSRCSFMSGWYPHVRGHRSMFHMMHKDEPVLLRELKKAGYFVWWGGKNDFVPAQDGFEEFCDVKFRPEGHVKTMRDIPGWRGDPEGDGYFSFYYGRIEKDDEEAVYYDYDWAGVLGALEQIKNLPEGKPFCIYLPLEYPHPPFAVEEPFYNMIDRNTVPPRIPTPKDWSGKASMLKGIYENTGMQGWSEERWTELRAVHYGMCSRLDHQLGMILDALKGKGLYEDTALFFIGDHGMYAGDYGLVDINQNTFEDSLTRVPFIVKPPAGVPVKPGVHDALVELVDFPATVADLAGLPQAHSHFGRSVLPLVAGERSTHRDAVFCEGGRLHGERHCMELEYEPGHKDPHNLYYPRLSLQAEEGPEHTKAVMCRTATHKYVRRLYEEDELYDLVRDPRELTNVIHDAAYADVLADLRERMLTWYVETCDVVPFAPDER